MDEGKVIYYQDRDSDSTLLKLVANGGENGLYLWQIGTQAWEKLEGEKSKVFYDLIYSPANHRVLSKKMAEEEIRKLGKAKKQ